MACIDSKYLGILCVIGGVIIQMTYGYFYTIGNMAPYMIDYMNSQNFSVKHTSSVWLTSVAISMEAVSMPLGGLLAKKIGARIVVIISCLLHSGSIALTYFALNWGFAALVFTYGALQGFGFGFGYAVLISVAALWFPSRRGLVVGLIVGGFGAGALVFTPIQTVYINPLNVPVNNITKTFTEPALLARVPLACLVLAGIIGSIQFLFVGLINEKPNKPDAPQGRSSGKDINKDETEQPSVQECLPLATIGQSGDQHLEVSGNQSTEKEWSVNLDRNLVIDMPPLQAIKTADFYLLWFAVGFAVVPITTVSSLYKVVGMEYIRDDRFLAGVAMAASLCNAGGRVVWGFICDRLSFKIPLCGIFIVWTAMLFSFPHLSVLTGVIAKVTYAFWVCSLFFCLSGVFVLAPTATEVLFGPTNMAVNYGLIYNAFIVGSMFASVINNLPILGGGVKYAFGNSGLMCVIALIIAIWIADRKAPDWFSVINMPTRLRVRLCRNCCSRRRSNPVQTDQTSDLVA